MPDDDKDADLHDLGQDSTSLGGALFIPAHSGIEIDPKVGALTVDQIDADIAAYRSILDARESESQVHKFLSSHTYFFNNLIRLHGYSPIYSKVKLGNEHETDFTYFEGGSFGVDWEFVEIEAPARRMFKDNLDATAELNHALEQIRSWDVWVRKNLAYATNFMPLIEFPFSYLFIGRRADLNDQSRAKLKQLNLMNRNTMRIHTLDSFVDNAESVKHLVRESGGGWQVPMHALTHSELMNRKPSYSFDYLNNPDTYERTKSGRQYMLASRDANQDL